MIDALIVSNVILWLIVIGLALAVMALTRQIGLLHERISPAGALSPQSRIKVGDRAPELALIDIHDRPLTLGGPSKDGTRTLLFFLSPTCPVCATLLPTVERVARTEVPRVRVVLASDGELEEHRAFCGEKRISHLPYVLSAPLGMSYGVSKLPYAVLIDSEGFVAAQGLVNTREHVESLFEAQRHGVASIQDYLREKTR
jgi:methylamine dehydrogenase accessory protein MauD